MHAVVATVNIEDPQVARAALADLRLTLVPRAPGLVTAYWLEPVDGVGMSIIVFVTREHADNAVAYPLPPLFILDPPGPKPEPDQTDALVDRLWSERERLSARLEEASERLRRLAARNFEVLDRVIEG